jgi:hypothetical protein
VGADGGNAIDPSTQGFVGFGTDGCVYFGIDSQIISGQLAGYLEAIIAGALQIKNDIDDAFEDVVDYTGEEFCSNIETDGSDSELPTVADLENDVGLIYDTLDESLENLINNINSTFDFANQYSDGELKQFIANILYIQSPVDADGAPDRFSISEDSIENWRTFALGNDDTDTDGEIDTFKSKLNGEDTDIYVALVDLYDNVSEEDNINEIPAVLEYIGTEAQELKNDSPDWSSVSLSALCATRDQLGEIHNFIDGILDDDEISNDHVPADIQRHLTDDPDESLTNIQDAYSVGKSFLNTYLKQNYIDLLGGICQLVVDYGSLGRLDDTPLRSYLGRVLDAFRFLEESTVCTKLWCNNQPPRPFVSPEGAARRSPNQLPEDIGSGYRAPNRNPNEIHPPGYTYTYPTLTPMEQLEAFGEFLWYALLFALALIAAVVLAKFAALIAGLLAGLTITAGTAAAGVIVAFAFVIVIGMVRTGQLEPFLQSWLGNENTA